MESGFSRRASFHRWLGIEAWSLQARSLLLVVGVLGIALAGWAWFTTLAYPGALEHPEWDFRHWLLLCFLTISVSGLSIKVVGSTGIITVSDTFLFTSVLLFGGPPSIALGWLDGFIGTLRATRKPASILYSSSMMAVSMFLAGLAFRGIQSWNPVHTPTDSVSALLLPLTTLTVVHFLCTTFGVSLLLAYRTNQSFGAIWRRDFLISGLTYITGAVAAGLSYFLIHRFGMPVFFTVAPFILFVYWTYCVYSERLLEYSQHLEHKVRERTLELEAANQRLQEMDRLKTEFLNIVAHDLRTPLTSINAYAQLMTLQPNQPERLPRYAKIIVDEANRLKLLLNNMLDLSKMEAGKMVYDMEPLEPDKLLQHFFELFEPLAHSNGIRFELRIAEGALPSVQGDRQRLGQVICNLLDNAFKFTPSGGCVRIEASAMEHEEQSWFEVRVLDEGPGIQEEDRKLIWEKYHVIPKKAQKPRSGTGLGLPISRQIIQGHRGILDFEPRAEGGSLFRFRIPSKADSAQK